MTQMSEYHAKTEPDFGVNPSEWLVVSRVARGVHDCRVLVGVLVSLILVGCVIPPSLSVENQDAGANSPPAITAVRSDQEELAEPGPIVLAPGEGSLNVSLLDTDQNDTLYVRVFVNYTVDDPTPARSTCTANPVSAMKRSVTCDARAVCQAADVTAPDRSLVATVVVFDRQPLESGDPMYQAMPEGGLSTSRTFFLTCDAAGGL